MSIINKIPEQLKDFYRKIFKRSDFGHFHSIALDTQAYACFHPRADETNQDKIFKMKALLKKHKESLF